MPAATACHASQRKFLCFFSSIFVLSFWKKLLWRWLRYQLTIWVGEWVSVNMSFSLSIRPSVSVGYLIFSFFLFVLRIASFFFSSFTFVYFCENDAKKSIFENAFAKNLDQSGVITYSPFILFISFLREALSTNILINFDKNLVELSKNYRNSFHFLVITAKIN